jgi:hypothetical protein
MKRKGEQINKRKKRKEGGEGGHDRGGRRKREKERRREWGLRPPDYDFVLAIKPFVLTFPINLVRNPFPVDVGIVGRTTSNMVFIVVFSLPLIYVSSDLAIQLGLHCAELHYSMVSFITQFFTLHNT